MRRSLVDALVSAFKLATRWQSTFSGSSTRVLCTTTSPPVFPLLVPLFVRTCYVIWKPSGLPLLPPCVSSFSRTGVVTSPSSPPADDWIWLPEDDQLE